MNTLRNVLQEADLVHGLNVTLEALQMPKKCKLHLAHPVLVFHLSS